MNRSHRKQLAQSIMKMHKIDKIADLISSRVDDELFYMTVQFKGVEPVESWDPEEKRYIIQGRMVIAMPLQDITQ